MIMVMIGILIGIPLGTICWATGLALAESYRKKHGCYRVCYHCGKPPFDIN
jgi:hypothetical protein